MEKILMVCLGNICRSPMAEGMLRHKLKESGIDAFVDSCGTSGWHIGETPDRRAVLKMQANEINISTLIARQFTISDFDEFDRIYTMDESNYEDVISLARDDNDRVKVKMLLDEIYPGEAMSVPDPYFGGDEGFENVYNLIDQACERIITSLK